MAEYSSREEKRRAQKASSKTKGTKKGSKKPKKSLIKRIVLIVFLLGFAALLGGGGLFAYYAFQAPELNEEDFIDPVSTEVLDMNENVIGRIGEQNRELVQYDDIPPLVENAVLAIEDVRFYDHMGVDAIRLAGAVLANITDGFGAEGASTLTQQVIKQSVLTPEKSLERKAQEAWLAYQLEQEYSKEDIFEMYVNKIYYSDGIYGIKTASEYYFDAELSQLGIHQAAFLAGLPQRPNAYNPYENPELAKERRDIVLRQMYNHDKISEDEMQQAIDTDIMDGMVDRSEESGNARNQLAGTEAKYDAFIDAVIDEVEAEGDFNPFEDGLKIYTTLDPEAQTKVENVLNGDSINFPADMDEQRSQAGVTLLDTQTGAIRAIGGGRNFGEEVQRGTNFAVDVRRDVGSTIKPLLDYAPAIEELNWSTAQIIVDEPYTYTDTDTQPGNYDGQFLGPITMREALYDSRNITAIKALKEAGLENGRNFINGLGFNVDAVYESSAIGSSTPTNTVGLAGAYAAFGNNGIYNEPHTITSIEFRDGSSIDLEPESNVAMQDSTAYMITDMLKDVVQPYGTGPLANVPGLPLAAKSGTTNYDADFRAENDIPSNGAPDSWFAGYTTQYTAAVWLGYPSYENYLTPEERQVSQVIFKEVMQSVHADIDTPDFEKPDSVVEVEVEIGTNPPQLASQFTPNEQKSTELFVRGTEPTAVSEEFVIEDLAPPSNLQAEYNEETQTVQLTWDHQQDENDDREVQFEVSYSVDGGEEQLLSTTSQNGLNIEQIVEGSSYTFSVIAIADEERSNAATINLDIVQREEEPEEELEEEPEEEPTEEEPTEEAPPEEPTDETEEGNNGNGQGNENGNGQGNGNGNGQGGGNNEDENEETPPAEETPEDPANPDEDADAQGASEDNE